MSSLEMFLVLYAFADIDPTRPRSDDRDRIVISHGHTSPGVYCALADAGFFALDDAVAHFRQAGSVFEGHVERSVPGVGPVVTPLIVCVKSIAFVPLMHGLAVVQSW